VIFAIVIAFWAAFWQNGFALTLWARDNTVTSLSPEVFQANGTRTRRSGYVPFWDTPS
jgi:hypothetical protein